MKVVVDKQKCTGCRMCELVCSVTKYGAFSTHKAHCHVAEGEALPNAPKFCAQCKKPLCRSACEFGAFDVVEVNGEEILSVNREKCVKCLKCVDACPFHAMFIDSGEGFPMKCNLCDGETKCVSQCPFGALSVK